MTVAFGLGGAVCVASGGSGCWVIGVMATMYSTSTMLAQGASLEQVIVANAFGIFAGQLAGGLGSAIAEGIGHGALGPILGGAVSGAVSTAISTSLSGGELGWNVLIGAAQGAATAGVTWGVANAIRVSQASERRTSRSRVEGGGEADGLPRRRWRVTTNGVRAQENQDSCVAASTRNEIWLETDQDLSEAGIRRELAPGKRDWDAEGVEALLAVSVLRRHGVDASVSGVLSLTDLVEASKKGPLTIGTIPPGGGSHRVILLGTTVEVTPGTPIDENNRFFSILDSLSAPYGQPIHAISLTRSEFIARWDNALPVIKLPEYASP
jgi:hypothetical protein